jgi:hypothetical protein
VFCLISTRAKNDTTREKKEEESAFKKASFFFLENLTYFSEDDRTPSVLNNLPGFFLYLESASTVVVRSLVSSLISTFAPRGDAVFVLILSAFSVRISVSIPSLCVCCGVRVPKQLDCLSVVPKSVPIVCSRFFLFLLSRTGIKSEEFGEGEGGWRTKAADFVPLSPFHLSKSNGRACYSPGAASLLFKICIVY